MNDSQYLVHSSINKISKAGALLKRQLSEVSFIYCDRYCNTLIHVIIGERKKRFMIRNSLLLGSALPLYTAILYVS